MRTVYMHRTYSGWVYSLLALTILAANVNSALGAEQIENVLVERSPVTGLASFVTPTQPGGVIPVQTPGGVAAVLPEDFLDHYGHLFGVVNRPNQLAVARAQVDTLGFTTTSYQQHHKGVPVFSAIVRVHQKANGGVAAANGDFYPIPDSLGVVPQISTDEAVTRAIEALGVGNPWVERSELVIVDPGWYGDPPAGPQLAYHIVLNDMAVPVREAFFVNATSGKLMDRWSMIHTARDREIYDGQNQAALPGVLVRAEGGAAVSLVDANRAYDYYGDVYDYFFRAFGRDSIDDAGMTMIATVNSTFVNPPCPNAFWNGIQMAFCDDTVTDDIVGHELTHGVTEFTANLIYQNQSGQLNESYSDIFGEMIDLFNGNAAFAGVPGGSPSWPTHSTGSGQDTPNNARSGSCSSPPSYPDGVRWMMGEDAAAFGGAIRDMWNPPCFSDPDRGNSALQTCPGNDNGGVHSGSGIPNHAFAILVDGKVFNGFNVSGIGPIKAGAVWYRALATYLTPGSDFKDAYNAMNQAAADLVGTFPNDPRTGLPSASVFTTFDADQVNLTLLATEMNVDGACGATVDVFDLADPQLCDSRVAVYSDGFEGGVNGWTVSNSNPPTPYNWAQVGSLPLGVSGTAWYIDDPSIGDCAGNDESGLHSLFSPVINLPLSLSEPTMRFKQYLITEAGYDGGNISVRVNGGAWQLVPSTEMTYNDYNTVMQPSPGNTSPLAGQEGWSGAANGWGTTLVDLSSYVVGGNTLQVRFDFGKDGCTGYTGWFIDDFEVYVCPCTVNGDCDDGLYCNGVETCVSGACQAGSDPCPTSGCSEAANQCAVFSEDFENGNVQNWNLNGPGSTASAGAWVFGNPNGTSTGGQQAQPENPFAGAGCGFTGQNTSLGTDDVDGGVTYLESPVFSLSGNTAAQAVFVRWYYNRDIGEDVNDFFVAQVSNNGGSSWVTLENLGTNNSANTWTTGTFNLETFVSLTGNMKLRFGASDGAGGNGNIIEAALDDVVVLGTAGCTTNSDCNDNNPCTNDVCTAGSCSNPNNTSSCSDGNACTTNDACSGGVCVGGPAPNCNDSNPCTTDTCSPASGCQNANNANSCNDGLFCTSGDTCSGGVCVGGSSPCPQFCNETTDQCVQCLTNAQCNDGIACTTDTCVGGSCQNATVDALCNDGLFCNGNEVCQAGVGCQSDGDPCGGLGVCDESSDVCLCDGPAAAPAGGRYLAVTPAAVGIGVAIRVTGHSSDTGVSCVSLYVQSDGSLGASPVFQTPATWGTIYVGDDEIQPSHSYRVETDCGEVGSPSYSLPTSVSTPDFGEVTGNASITLDDILREIGAFAGNFAPGTTLETYDIAPCVLDGTVSIDDILAVVAAFSGAGSPCAAPCP